VVGWTEVSDLDRKTGSAAPSRSGCARQRPTRQHWSPRRRHATLESQNHFCRETLSNKVRVLVTDPTGRKADWRLWRMKQHDSGHFQGLFPTATESLARAGRECSVGARRVWRVFAAGTNPPATIEGLLLVTSQNDKCVVAGSPKWWRRKRDCVAPPKLLLSCFHVFEEKCE
jgi:hypothetical protein